jgi:preprotein translocase subunit Sec61beta
MREKRALYREAGAEEVWVVSETGTVRFFGDEEMETSQIAPDVPEEL